MIKCKKKEKNLIFLRFLLLLAHALMQIIELEEISMLSYSPRFPLFRNSINLVEIVKNTNLRGMNQQQKKLN